MIEELKEYVKRELLLGLEFRVTKRSLDPLVCQGPQFLIRSNTGVTGCYEDFCSQTADVEQAMWDENGDSKLFFLIKERTNCSEISSEIAVENNQSKAGETQGLRVEIASDSWNTVRRSVYDIIWEYLYSYIGLDPGTEPPNKQRVQTGNTMTKHRRAQECKG